MLDQILWFDALLKLAAGLPLAILPKATVAVFGLPRVQNGFYVRLLGAVLVGLAVAIIAEGRSGHTQAGLGPAGALSVNIAGGIVLIGQIVFGRSDLTFRGRLLCWGILAAMSALAIAEFALS